MQCTVCSSFNVTKAQRVNGYQLHHCHRCSHLFVSDSISSEVLDKVYDHAFYLQSAEARECEGYRDYLGTLDRRINGFRNWYLAVTADVGGPGRCLDFGCAVGAMVKAAQDCGWEAIGYERSQWAARYGREHLGVQIVTGDGQLNQFEPSSFDLITMWDVVEHLEHPREVIGLASRWLKPSGWLAVNTVDGGSWGARLAGQRWRHLGPPRHLQYFTRRSLRYLLREQGFWIRRQRGNGVFLEARTRQRTLGPVGGCIEAGVTQWRLRKFVDLLHLRDEVEMLARKA